MEFNKKNVKINNKLLKLYNLISHVGWNVINIIAYSRIIILIYII